MPEQSPLTAQIATTMRRLRKARGWSQAALAELVPGWNRTTVAKLEAGHRENLTVDELVAVAGALDISVAAMLEQDDAPDSSAGDFIGQARALLDLALAGLPTGAPAETASDD